MATKGQYWKPKPGRSLSEKYPQLCKDWDYEKNDLTPEQITYGSSYNAYWKCHACGYEWQNRVCNRISKNRPNLCPKCSTKNMAEKRKQIDYNESLESKYPQALADWDYDKNDIKPSEVGKCSEQEVHWKCHVCGYEWKQQINRRLASVCPNCHEHAPVNKSRSIIKHPEYMGQLLIDVSQELFNEIAEFPCNCTEHEQLKADYQRTVAWKCHICGHKWRDTPYHRTVCDIQCPNCAKIAKEHSKRKAKIVAREDSIGVLYPRVLKFWDFNKNQVLDCTPYDISPGTSQKIYWKCPDCGYEWVQHPTVLVHGGGCPICAIKHGVLLHETPEPNKSFADLFPDLLSDWDYTKNDRSPYAIKPHSNKDIAWKCHVCGYEWTTRLQNRTDSHQGCPKCAMNSHTSFPEQAVFFFLHRDLFPDAISQYFITHNDYTNYKYALDIYVPSRRIAIEYDGEYWHNLKNAQEKDELKEQRIHELGIKLYRIVENNEINELIDNKLYFITHQAISLRAYHASIEQAIIRFERLFGIENPTDIDIKKYQNDILRQYK